MKLERPAPRRALEIGLSLGLVLILVLWAAVLFWTEEDREATAARKRMFAVAEVTDILEDTAEVQDWTEGRRIGQQELEIEVLTGPWKGAVLETPNYLTIYTNVDARVGTRIIVRLDADEQGQPYVLSIPNYNRVPMLLGLMAVFAGLLVLIGRRKGVMALIGLVYTLACLWFILVPMILRGADPVLVTVVIVALTTAASLLLLTGLSRKTLCATLGCVGGVAAAGLFAAAAGTVSPINGFNLPEAEELVLRAGDQGLQISGLFVSGILVASLGAVMDVAMSIASACWELRQVDPEPAPDGAVPLRHEHRPGRHGHHGQHPDPGLRRCRLNTLLLCQVYDYPLIQIFNADAIAVEMIRGVAGSIGILLTVPLVALLSARLMSPRK